VPRAGARGDERRPAGWRRRRGAGRMRQAASQTPARQRAKSEWRVAAAAICHVSRLGASGVSWRQGQGLRTLVLSHRRQGGRVARRRAPAAGQATRTRRPGATPGRRTGTGRIGHLSHGRVGFRSTGTYNSCRLRLICRFAYADAAKQQGWWVAVRSALNLGAPRDASSRGGGSPGGWVVLCRSVSVYSCTVGFSTKGPHIHTMKLNTVLVRTSTGWR
jgi:hypothetical protein